MKTRLLEASLVMAASSVVLAGCGSDDPANPPTGAGSVDSQGDPVVIGVTVYVDHPSR
jgi:uncharacterized lipoprotein YajG